MRLLLIIIIMFFNLGLAAQQLFITNAYSFYEPDFAGLIPFSKDQLGIIKAQEIRKVEKIWDPILKNHSKTVFYFNERGYLTNETTFNVNDERLMLIDSTYYVYDNTDRLILKKMNGKIFSSFDSISYDSESRITYYDSSFDYKSKDTIEHETHYKLRLQHIKGDTIILVEKLDPAYSAEYFFTNGDLLKIKTPFKTDSIVISYMDSISWKKTYWFKSHRVKNFQVGMVKIYEKNILLQDSIMGMYSSDIGVINYYYNRQKQLIRTETLAAQTFVVYDNRGLISSVIENYGGELSLTKCQYFY